MHTAHIEQTISSALVVVLISAEVSGRVAGPPQVGRVGVGCTVVQMPLLDEGVL